MGIPIVFGGIHPTCVPEEVIKNDFVDFVIRGEGEYALLDLVNSLDSGGFNYEIKSVWFKKNGEIIRNPLHPLIQDLDKLPFPDKELFCREDSNFKTGHLLMTGRGCFYRCTFCMNNFLKSLYPGERYVRRRSVDNVILELEIVKNKYSISQIEICDDLFCYDKKWLKEFSKKYSDKINIPFHIFAHPQEIDE